MKAFEVGNIIKILLLSSDELTGLVGKRIFTAVAPEKTASPFIVYRRVGVTPHGTKDRRSVCDTVKVEIAIGAEGYTQSVNVANAAIAALKAPIGDVEGVEVDEIRLTDSEEYFTEGCYVQDMIFEIDIINN